MCYWSPTKGKDRGEGLLKVCAHCGREKELSAFTVTKSGPKQGRRSPICKECSKSMRNYYRIRRAEGRASDIIGKIRARAKAKGWKFDLTTQWLRMKMRQAICEVTGLPFDLGPAERPNHINPFAPSVDRIDNSKGYTQDNCRVVVWIYNRAKGPDSDQDVFILASALLEGKWITYQSISSFMS